MNDVRIGRISPKDIDKIDVEIRIKKIPLSDLDESQNPMNSFRKNVRPQTTTHKTNRNRSMTTRSMNFDNNKSMEESNLKTMVNTFFTYDMNSACQPEVKFKDNINLRNVKSAYSI